jgi:hypothetical protein
MRAGPEAPGEPAARVSTRAKVAHGPLHLPIQLWMAYFSTLLAEALVEVRRLPGRQVKDIISAAIASARDTSTLAP